MRIPHLFWAALMAAAVLMPGCKTTAGGDKPGRWLPYPERTAIAEAQLRSKLKVERREAMSITPTDSGEQSYLSEIALYNERGLPTLVQLMDATGKVTKETKYSYKDSLLMRETVEEATGYSSAMQYTYNEKGFKVRELFFQRGDSILQRDYTLDEWGNEILVHLKKFRDGAKMELHTERDAAGRPVKVQEIQNKQTNWTEVYVMTDTLWRIKRTNAKGELQSDYEMRFDKHEAITEMVNRGPDGVPRVTIRYENDREGRPVKEEFFGAQGQSMQMTTTRYDKKGLLVEKRFTAPTQVGASFTRYSYFYRR